MISPAQVQIVWTNTFRSRPTPANDQVRDAVLDTNGNLYLTGTTYTVRYDKDGNVVWQIPLPGWSLALDNTNLYVVYPVSNLTKLNLQGQTIWTRSDVSGIGVKLDHERNPLVLVNRGFQAAKFLPTGELLWNYFYEAGGTNPLATRSFDIGPDNSLYIAGALGSSEGPQITAMRVDSFGRFVWVRQYDQSTNSLANWITADPFGNAFLTGQINRYSELIVLHYDAQGNQTIFDRFRGHIAQDSLSVEGGGTIQLDREGNLYITGASYGGGTREGVIIKYDSSGRRLWTAFTISSPARLTFDNDGNFYTADVTNLYKYGGDGTRLWAFLFQPGGLLFLDAEKSIYLASGITRQIFPWVYEDVYFAAKLKQETLPVPKISTPPTNQTLLRGSTAVLRVVADGLGASITHQWNFGGNPLSGQTNETLVLEQLDVEKSGWYSVTVSNRFGAVVSPDARILAVTRLENPQLLADGRFTFSFQADPLHDYLVQASTNLIDWMTVGTVSGLEELHTFNDVTNHNFTQRFYRLLLSM